MKNVARIAAILFLLFSALSSSKASAIIFLCGDICLSWQSCSRNCTDDTSGNFTNCGNWGCCVSNTTNC